MNRRVRVLFLLLRLLLPLPPLLFSLLVILGHASLEISAAFPAWTAPNVTVIIGGKAGEAPRENGTHGSCGGEVAACGFCVHGCGRVSCAYAHPVHMFHLHFSSHGLRRRQFTVHCAAIVVGGPLQTSLEYK